MASESFMLDQTNNWWRDFGLARRKLAKVGVLAWRLNSVADFIQIRARIVLSLINSMVWNLWTWYDTVHMSEIGEYTGQSCNLLQYITKRNGEWHVSIIICISRMLNRSCDCNICKFKLVHIRNDI